MHPREGKRMLGSNGVKREVQTHCSAAARTIYSWTPHASRRAYGERLPVSCHPVVATSCRCAIGSLVLATADKDDALGHHDHVIGKDRVGEAVAAFRLLALLHHDR